MGEGATKRSVLIVTPGDGVPDCLVYAIEREFPSTSVVQVRTPEAARIAIEHPVALILMDATFLLQIADWAAPLSKAHPGASVAFMQEERHPPVSIRQVRSWGLVRGVVPMNLKLDIWLSIIRLILRGGEYFPLKILDEPAVPGLATEAVLADPDSRPGELVPLTERESQILDLVATGLQNKIIASTLQLSEHTVKIHLHHIITKLGVHNRTEAAAAYHARRSVPAMADGGERALPLHLP